MKDLYTQQLKLARDDAVRLRWAKRDTVAQPYLSRGIGVVVEGRGLEDSGRRIWRTRPLLPKAPILIGERQGLLITVRAKQTGPNTGFDKEEIGVTERDRYVKSRNLKEENTRIHRAMN